MDRNLRFGNLRFERGVAKFEGGEFASDEETRSYGFRHGDFHNELAVFQIEIQTGEHAAELGNEEGGGDESDFEQ